MERPHDPLESPHSNLGVFPADEFPEHANTHAFALDLWDVVGGDAVRDDAHLGFVADLGDHIGALCNVHQYYVYEELTEETLLGMELIITAWISVDEDGCWIWNGRKKDGYSSLIINGRWYSVHRWLYMHLVGPIPNAHEMHHECEKPACVRPGHLRPLTPERHREITAFSKWMFSVMPSAVLAIENTSHTDAERMFARVYELPSDESQLGMSRPLPLAVAV